MESFKYQDQVIKYIKVGSGRPIVFLHNGGTSHVIWSDVIEQIQDSYEVYAIDLLGYGSSSRPVKEYSIDTHLDVLSLFIEHHGLNEVMLVGNCMGSAISIKYVMKFPEKVRALILLNPLTVQTFRAGQLGSMLAMRQYAPKFSQMMFKGLGGIRLNDFLSKQSLRMQFGPIGRSKSLEKRSDLCACFTREGQVDSLLRTLDDLVNYGDLDQFSPPENFPPICTIWGLENKILSADAGRRLNTTLQPEREEWIAGGGHLVMMEEPEKIAGVIRDFITSK